MATKVTSKGQVTIPKPVRDHLGIVPGSEVTFRRVADGSIVVEKADMAGREPSRFAKARGSAGPGMTTDDQARLKALERENKELRRANEILRKASAYFAQAELDRRGT